MKRRLPQRSAQEVRIRGRVVAEDGDAVEWAGRDTRGAQEVKIRWRRGAESASPWRRLVA